jgi:hypothetical protein
MLEATPAVAGSGGGEGAVSILIHHTTTTFQQSHLTPSKDNSSFIIMSFLFRKSTVKGRIYLAEMYIPLAPATFTEST